MNIWIYAYEERNCKSRLSHFHYVEQAKLEAACVERVTLNYEGASPFYTL